MTPVNAQAGFQPPWMNNAWAALGEHEIDGPATNPNIREFYRDAGHDGISSDEVPWCAAFVGACLKRAGLSGTNSLLARSYLSWGKSIQLPQLGCVAVFSRGSNPAHGHVGFWVGETLDSILVLGGNQSDSVSVEPVARTRLLAYRWPADAPDIQKPKADSAGPQNVSYTANDEAVFDAAMAHILHIEGGYTDDPHDPGGPTNKGITLATFARYRRVAIDDTSRARLVRELKALSDAEARGIYQSFYWSKSRAAELPAPLALMHFDAAVNHGVGAAARFLQRSVGADVDGEIGPLTLAAANSIPLDEALERYAAHRRERYRSLHHFWRFGRGWLRRVNITLRSARALTTLLPPSSPAPPPNGATKLNEQPEPTAPAQPPPAASTQQTDAATSKWWGQSMTIWGITITTLSTVLPALAPLSGLDLTPDMIRQLGEETLRTAQAIGGLIGTILAVYGRLRSSTPLTRKEIRLQM